MVRKSAEIILRDLASWVESRVNDEVLDFKNRMRTPTKVSTNSAYRATGRLEALEEVLERIADERA